MPRHRDSKGRFDSGGLMSRARDNPGATAAVAAGIAGLAAAGAFAWTRRDRIGDALSNGKDWLNELKAERMKRQQHEIAEEALTLKETGRRRSKGPRGPIPQQEIRAGMATTH